MDNELEKIWTAFGLQHQAFPLLYPLGPARFLDANGNASGAIGSIATLTRDLSNFPHMLIGIRIRNVFTFAMPVQSPGDAIEEFRALHEWVDDEQTVAVELAHQNPLSAPTLQSLMIGSRGYHWHPWPVPYPMAGSNNISVVVRRVTGYPNLAGAAVIPDVYAVLVTAVLHADRRSVAPQRVGRG